MDCLSPLWQQLKGKYLVCSVHWTFCSQQWKVNICTQNTSSHQEMQLCQAADGLIQQNRWWQVVSIAMWFFSVKYNLLSDSLSVTEKERWKWGKLRKGKAKLMLLSILFSVFFSFIWREDLTLTIILSSWNHTLLHITLCLLPLHNSCVTVSKNQRTWQKNKCNM